MIVAIVFTMLPMVAFAAETKEPTPTATPTATVAPTTAPSVDPELDVGDFIERCYNVALGRESDEAGYDLWKSKLNNGQACGVQVGYGFIFSPEYTLKNTSNEQYVKDLYTLFFDREPDEAGFAYWVDQLNAGTADRDSVFGGLADSVEFYNLCLKYGVVAGYYVVGVDYVHQDRVNSFVARLYNVCLNRIPDQGGQAGWVQKLILRETTGRTAAYGFVFSPEFVDLNLSDKDFVISMYRAFFGRNASDDEIKGWTEIMANGITREYVFNGFAGSTEFDALCKSYGISA